MAKRKEAQDSLTEDMMRRFDEAYAAVEGPFQRMQNAQATYDNVIETSRWPTTSEMAIPYMFTSVEKQLAPTMEYLFQDVNPIDLTPHGRVMPRDVVQEIENNIWYTSRTEMNLQLSMIPSLRDTYKFGVGYAMIDTMVVSPPEAVTVFTGSREGLADQSRQLRIGKPTTQIFYDYIPACNVIPMPDGAEVDGPNRASGHFVLKNYTETEFRSLYENDDNGIMKGNPQEIIDLAKSGSYDTRMVSSDILAKISGMDLNISNSGTGDLPTIIPVLKGFFENEHIWIALGYTTIYHRKDAVQTMRSDLIKLSAWPDSNRWFPLHPIEAAQDLSLGSNIWHNAMFDLAQYHMNPTRVINTRMIDGDKTDIPRGPGADVNVTGAAGDAVSYLRNPDFPQALFGLASTLDTVRGDVMGQPATVGQGAPGLVRGGANALESLLSETTGRQLLASTILRLGGFKSIFEKILLKRQMLIADDGEKWIAPATDPATGEEFYAEHTVTLEDMRSVFHMNINLESVSLNSAIDFQERMAIHNATESAPAIFDQRARWEELIGNTDKARKMMLPEDVVKQNAERLAEAQIATAEAGAAQPGAQGAPQIQQPPPNPGVPA